MTTKQKISILVTAVCYVALLLGMMVWVSGIEDTYAPQAVSPLEGMANTPTPKPTAYVDHNLLLNPSFAGDYLNCGQSCNVAPGWVAWTSDTLSPPCIAGEPECFIPCPSNCDNCKRDYGCWWTRAEHKAATLQFPERVHSGEKAQQAFTYGRMGQFGVYQIVSNVPVGAELEFSIYVQAWQCYNYPDCQPDKMNLRIGVDPFGDIDPYGNSVTWSDPIESFDEYTRMSMRVIAQNDMVTVFTYARPEWDWARKNNDAYWDDASLVVVESPTPTPTPTITPTPQPMGYRIDLPIVDKNYRYLYPTPTPGPHDLSKALVTIRGNEVYISNVTHSIEAVELALAYEGNLTSIHLGNAWASGMATWYFRNGAIYATLEGEQAGEGLLATFSGVTSMWPVTSQTPILCGAVCQDCPPGAAQSIAIFIALDGGGFITPCWIAG